MWEKWSWIKRESLSTFWREKKKNPQIQFVLLSIPNHVSRLRRHPCSAPGHDMLIPHMPGVCCVLFKVCQEVHRGECVSSLLNPEPLVSHHITNLPPPAVCADPATKHFLPGCCTEHLRRLFVPTAIRLQTVRCFLPDWLQPPPATRVLKQDAAAHPDYHGLVVPLVCSIQPCLHEACASDVYASAIVKWTVAYVFFST